MTILRFIHLHCLNHVCEPLSIHTAVSAPPFTSGRTSCQGFVCVFLALETMGNETAWIMLEVELFIFNSYFLCTTWFIPFYLLWLCSCWQIWCKTTNGRIFNLLIRKDSSSIFFVVQDEMGSWQGGKRQGTTGTGHQSNPGLTQWDKQPLMLTLTHSLWECAIIWNRDPVIRRQH